VNAYYSINPSLGRVIISWSGLILAEEGKREDLEFALKKCGEDPIKQLIISHCEKRENNTVSILTSLCNIIYYTKSEEILENFIKLIRRYITHYYLYDLEDVENIATYIGLIARRASRKASSPSSYEESRKLVKTALELLEAYSDVSLKAASAIVREIKEVAEKPNSIELAKIIEEIYLDEEIKKVIDIYSKKSPEVMSKVIPLFWAIAYYTKSEDIAVKVAKTMRKFSQYPEVAEKLTKEFFNLIEHKVSKEVIENWSRILRNTITGRIIAYGNLSLLELTEYLYPSKSRK